MREILESLLKLQDLELGSKTGDHSKEIRELRAKIPAPILGHFDRLLARGKKGVSTVHNGVCRECHMRVAIGVLATVMHGDDIQLCGTCGRYLYLPPEAAVATPAPAPAPAKPAAKRKSRAVAHA